MLVEFNVFQGFLVEVDAGQIGDNVMKADILV